MNDATQASLLQQQQRSYNSLLASQKHKLNAWLEREQERLRGHTYAEVAEIASNELGFKITGGNVHGATSATGVVLRVPPPKPVSNEELMKRITTLENILSGVIDLVNVHTDQLVKLARTAHGAGR